MSQPALRFIHASDLHLERPLAGVAEVPENLREVFLEAPFQAAELVFETALSEGADALLLAGDVVDFDRVGPRAVVFLNEQFQRLADHGIKVYWACGDIDPPDSWPASIELPANVHVFSVGRVESFEHRRDGEVVARPTEIAGEEREITCVSMGNPHCILRVESLDDFPVEKIGPVIETDPLFPNRTNVEFIEVINEGEFRMRVWERGAGETLSCGTGACAATVAAALNGWTGRKVRIHLAGGILQIDWREDNRVILTGPAEEVFTGVLDL